MLKEGLEKPKVLVSIRPVRSGRTRDARGNVLPAVVMLFGGSAGPHLFFGMSMDWLLAWPADLACEVRVITRSLFQGGSAGAGVGDVGPVGLDDVSVVGNSGVAKCGRVRRNGSCV
jgi:hypothetical protein